jgi:hypothetical protein
MVVEFPIYANERVLYIALMGGQGGPDIDWDETMKNVHKIKENNGCKRVISHLRDGWFRRFKTKKLTTLCEIEVP